MKSLFRAVPALVIVFLAGLIAGCKNISPTNTTLPTEASTTQPLEISPDSITHDDIESARQIIAAATIKTGVFPIRGLNADEAAAIHQFDGVVQSAITAGAGPDQVSVGLTGTPNPVVPGNAFYPIASGKFRGHRASIGATMTTFVAKIPLRGLDTYMGNVQDEFGLTCLLFYSRQGLNGWCDNVSTTGMLNIDMSVLDAASRPQDRMPWQLVVQTVACGPVGSSTVVPDPASMTFEKGGNVYPGTGSSRSYNVRFTGGNSNGDSCGG